MLTGGVEGNPARVPLPRDVEGNPARVPLPTGVLPDHELRAAVEGGWISARAPLADAQFQPASLDLRLGSVAYQLRASFLPYRESVQDRLDAGDGDLVIDRLSLAEGATLQRDPAAGSPLVYDDDDRPVPIERAVFNDELCMGVELSGRTTGGIVGYRAHPNPPAVDLARVGHYGPAEFWEPIKRPGRDAY